MTASGVDDAALERVLLWLLDLDPPINLRLDSDGQEDELGLPDVAVDEALHEAKDRFFVLGERTDYGAARRC